MYSTIKTLWGQFKILLPILLLIYVPVLVIFTILTLQQDIPLNLLLDDTTYIANVPFYVGSLSNFGVMLWAVTAAICIFTFVLLKGTKQDITWFLLISGLISLYFALDDMLLFHDEILLRYVGIPEPVIFLTYGLVIIVYVFRFRRTIAQSEMLLLLLALGLFVFSLGVDNIRELLPGLYTGITDAVGGSVAVSESGAVKATVSTGVGNVRYMLEDGSKLLGIIAWLSYFLRYSLQHVREKFATPTQLPQNTQSV